jgi:hypothetical protein
MQPRRFAVLCTLALAVAAATAATARANELFLGTFSGAAEVPPTASPGTGTAQVDYDPTGRTLFVHADFSGLSAVVSSAHIHCCASPTATAPVAITLTGFPAGVTSGTYDHLFNLAEPSTYSAGFLTSSGGTAAGAEASLIAAARAGGLYLNIHNSSFPGGAIRASLVPTRIFADGFEDGGTAEWSVVVP